MFGLGVVLVQPVEALAGLLDPSLGDEPGRALGDEHDDDGRDDGVDVAQPGDQPPVDEPALEVCQHHAQGGVGRRRGDEGAPHVRLRDLGYVDYRRTCAPSCGDKMVLSHAPKNKCAPRIIWLA